MSLQDLENCDWKSSDLIIPFFNGGKIYHSSSTLTFMNDSNVYSFRMESPTEAICSPCEWRGVHENSEKITQNEEITCFCMSKDGDALATVSASFLLQHWIISEKTSRKSIKIHKTPVLCMEFDFTSTLVGTGSSDGTVRVWDVFRGYCTHTFKSQSEVIRVLSFRQDSTVIHLYSGSDDGSLKCYDLLKSSCVADFRHHVGSPTSMSFSVDDSNVLATVGRDKVRVDAT
jgi:WD40 repeat protein